MAETEAVAVAEEDNNYGAPPWLHLLSAFLAMEPTDSLITISRICGGGSITEKVQSFVWNHCFRKADAKGYTPYLRNFLKKLILEIESAGGVVCDELYEQFSFYMTSMKGDDTATGNSRVLKQVSFLFPSEGLDTPTCLSSRKLLITLQCSLNMLEGDTGCSIWPSGLFLSEFILSCPEVFYMKSCFEVGSGVGLVGICLAHVKASKVTLSDGDLSSLANLKRNLELNKLSLGTSLLKSTQGLNPVQYLHLPWESATESDLQDHIPDIVLGADVIYDPLCIPHLVRVLAALLRPKKSKSPVQMHSIDVCQGKANNGTTDPHYKYPASMEGPVAYIASVIRNIDTFNYFFEVADQAYLTVRDITENYKPFGLLPYMLSYQRSNVRLLAVSCVSH